MYLYLRHIPEEVLKKVLMDLNPKFLFLKILQYKYYSNSNLILFFVEIPHLFLTVKIHILNIIPK